MELLHDVLMIVVMWLVCLKWFSMVVVNTCIHDDNESDVYTFIPTCAYIHTFIHTCTYIYTFIPTCAYIHTNLLCDT